MPNPIEYPIEVTEGAADVNSRYLVTIDVWDTKTDDRITVQIPMPQRDAINMSSFAGDIATKAGLRAGIKKGDSRDEESLLEHGIRVTRTEFTEKSDDPTFPN